MPSNTAPTRVAILGGGLGSMVTALELTSPGVNAGKYDITVYQTGWRLGGKGASGRNAAEHDRIEEHGLHVWLGFYENAFRLLRGLMAEWNIPTSHPWAASSKDDRWRNAFHPHTYAPLTEKRPHGWETWQIDFPLRNNGTPGDGVPQAEDLWSLLVRLHESLLSIFEDGGPVFQDASTPAKEHAPKMHERVKRMRSKFPHLTKAFEKPHVDKRGCLSMLGLSRLRLLRLAEEMCDLSLEELLTNPLEPIRRLGIVLNLGWSLLRGLLDNYFSIERGTFDVLDDKDLRDWLRDYGAHDDAVNSPVVSALYDAIFAWENGDPATARLAAGAGLRCMLRIFFSYKHALSWKMQAGMGDTIFTPMYEVLKARGVKFKFFHEVKNLGLTDDKKTISKVTLGRQVTLNNGATSYDPLVTVNGLGCWPSEPRWAQITEAAQIRAGGFNLEHADNGWADLETLTLNAGEHFDQILLGISIGALPIVAPELIAANPRFATMVQQVKTVRTQAHQAWLKKDLSGLGWKEGSPILSNFVDPLNTWADMTGLLARENNPDAVKSLHYFCGPMLESIPVATAPAAVRANVDEMRNAMAEVLWPGARMADGRFDNALVDNEYLRTNTNPSDRYVLTIPGSTEHRLRPSESGFANLTLAGDWTRNQFNVGCVEATVMSGRFASQAISGRPTNAEIAYSNGP